MDGKPELMITEDGSHTLYLRDLDEYYHSRFGAITESRHVFIEAGMRSVSPNSISILEMGFGTGLNAFLTWIEARDSGRSVRYTGVEMVPLEQTILKKLNYGKLTGKIEAGYFKLIHEAPWNSSTVISEEFILEKLIMDIQNLEIRDQFDLVYFDAFSPSKQPELWTVEIFSRIHRSMRSSSALTTYSSGGQVKRNLVEAGFRIEKLPGPPGKREMIRAWKE